MRLSPTAPWLPPITSSRGPGPAGTQAGRRAGSKKACRTGVPVMTGWQPPSWPAAWGRPRATWLQRRPSSRVTRPGTALDSCNTTGMPHQRAAKIAGAAM